MGFNQSEFYYVYEFASSLYFSKLCTDFAFFFSFCLLLYFQVLHSEDKDGMYRSPFYAYKSLLGVSTNQCNPVIVFHFDYHKQFFLSDVVHKLV